ncbi:hypothetical protein GUJ93_ZPchr0316g2712 [Zizania palustris]|uniref:Uncharacterized protein n=1 Tax=Zizania palustris TaxID=103762 RepID=A0A8J5QUF6_ZIZPA|nr:hypothetical protein GUJ93_ZPchr0316g2712 [Zizania palustris]
MQEDIGHVNVDHLLYPSLVGVSCTDQTWFNCSCFAVDEICFGIRTMLIKNFNVLKRWQNPMLNCSWSHGTVLTLQFQTIPN